MELREMILSIESKNPGALKVASSNLSIKKTAADSVGKRKLLKKQVIESLLEMLPEYLNRMERNELNALHQTVTSWKASQRLPSQEDQRSAEAALVDAGNADPVSTPSEGATSPMGVFREMLRSVKKTPVLLGMVKEGDYLRVRRFRDHVRVYDLSNAGKKGKKTKTLSFSVKDRMADDLSSALLEVTFKEASKWGKELRAISEGKVRVSQSEVPSKDVLPKDQGPVRTETSNLKIIIDADTFIIVNKKDTHNHASIVPPMTQSGRTSKRELKKLSAWARDNMEALVSMTYKEVRQALSTTNLKYTQNYS